jgi:hypothetical protein
VRRRMLGGGRIPRVGLLVEELLIVLVVGSFFFVYN